jgi:hypothetical protein
MFVPFCTVPEKKVPLRQNPTPSAKKNEYFTELWVSSSRRHHDKSVKKVCMKNTPWQDFGMPQNVLFNYPKILHI